MGVWSGKVSSFLFPAPPPLCLCFLAAMGKAASSTKPSTMLYLLCRQPTMGWNFLKLWAKWACHPSSCHCPVFCHSYEKALIQTVTKCKLSLSLSPFVLPMQKHLWEDHMPWVIHIVTLNLFVTVDKYPSVSEFYFPYLQHAGKKNLFPLT